MGYGSDTRLIFECPHCGTRGGHETVRTPRAIYYWADETTPLFEEIAGRDIAYRVHVKRCVNTKCGRGFQSVELAHHYLEAMITEIQGLRREGMSFYG